MNASATTSTPAPSRPIAAVLQAEGATIGLAAVLAYGHWGASWYLFAALILAPDLMMLGYLVNTRIGALLYNFGHAYIGPVLLGVLAVATNHDLMGHICLIWIAHIGLDRAIGYGLKYAAGFKQTHLSRV